MKISKVIVFAVLAIALLPQPVWAQKHKPDQNQQPSLVNLMNHIQDLSASQYEGRLAGSLTYRAAAQYVAEDLSQYGVQPYQGDWDQLFEIEYNKIENCTFNTYVNDNDTRTRYVLGNDFSCAGMTGRGYADAGVVFCGYGIDAPAFNEYAHVDAKGKIVVVLSETPNFLPSTVVDSFATVRQKARAAQRHGACALVIINTNKLCPPSVVQGYVYSGEQPHLPTFPIIQPTWSCGERLFANESLSLQKAMDTLQTTMVPQSFHFRKKFEIEVNAKYHPAAVTTNVIGIYPGEDKKLANEYIVIGAHMDHVGMQGNTCLFPGANNNASGVAVLLETGRMLSQAYPQPRRSVVFVVFSGGETQNLGSEIFLSNFNPLKRIEAFINVDCVGAGDSLVAQGNNAFPDLFKVACNMDSAFTNHRLVRGQKINAKGDAALFAKIGIPSLTFTNLNGNRYNHMPTDIPENIDRQYIVKAAKLVYETVYELTFGDYQGRSMASKKVRFE